MPSGPGPVSWTTPSPHWVEDEDEEDEDAGDEEADDQLLLVELPDQDDEL